jgi:hypothetical protein
MLLAAFQAEDCHEDWHSVSWSCVRLTALATLMQLHCCAALLGSKQSVCSLQQVCLPDCTIYQHMRACMLACCKGLWGCVRRQQQLLELPVVTVHMFCNWCVWSHDRLVMQHGQHGSSGCSSGGGSSSSSNGSIVGKQAQLSSEYDYLFGSAMPGSMWGTVVVT